MDRNTHIGSRWERLVNMGLAPADSEDERLNKRTLTRVAMTISLVATIWVFTYLMLGLIVSALIPLVYQAAAVVSLTIFARTKRFPGLRTSQLSLMTLFPFLLMWSLGGFANSSAVAIWAFVTPILAFLFGAREWPWLTGLITLTVFSGLIDGYLVANAPAIPQSVITLMFVLNFSGSAFMVFLALAFFTRERERNRAALAEQHRLLQAEKARSERLLNNILPEPIAVRLRRGETVIADAAADVTVLFADIVGFTPISEGLAPERVVALLNQVFSTFDDLADQWQLEKIKTIGDAYMVVGGLPTPRPDHTEAVAAMALAMQHAIASVPDRGEGLSLRIGIDRGPVVAGVIGKRKFSYDLWGDTVNTASRMESQGEPGRIQVTERVHARLRDHFEFEPRLDVVIKGKGTMSTYFLEGPKIGNLTDAEGERRRAARRV